MGGWQTRNLQETDVVMTTPALQPIIFCDFECMASKGRLQKKVRGGKRWSEGREKRLYQIENTWGAHMAQTSISVNGETKSVDVDPATPLLWVLREQLGLTGTKFGCGLALCGACPVHVDGNAARSCVTP